jgi:uncharacterized protein (UPF0216 family)
MSQDQYENLDGEQFPVVIEISKRRKHPVTIDLDADAERIARFMGLTREQFVNEAVNARVNALKRLITEAQK